MPGITAKVLYQNCDAFLQVSLRKKDQIDEKRLRFINENTGKGFLRVKWEKTAARNVLKYKVSNMTALSEYIKQTMTQETYFGIICQLQKILEYCSEDKLSAENILLNDPKNVYYDVEKKKVYVAYLPLSVNDRKGGGAVKLLSKLHKNANITVSDGKIIEKYGSFIEDYIKSRKDGSFTHNHLYILLHDMLSIPVDELAGSASQEQPERKQSSGAPEDSDHTIIVNRNRSIECPAFLRDENNREIPIDHFPFTIGRKTDNDLALTDRGTVSKEHAAITYENGEFFIEDRNSANGTFLNSFAENGQRITKEKLGSGDVIYIYDSPFVFNINSSDSATVIVDGRNAGEAKKSPSGKKLKSIAYLLNSSSGAKIPIFVYPFTCAEISGLIIGRENSGSRHSIYIENISCTSLSVEDSEMTEGERTDIFSGCNFLYHGIAYTFYEES